MDYTGYLFLLPIGFITSIYQRIIIHYYRPGLPWRILLLRRGNIPVYPLSDKYICIVRYCLRRSQERRRRKVSQLGLHTLKSSRYHGVSALCAYYFRVMTYTGGALRIRSARIRT